MSTDFRLNGNFLKGQIYILIVIFQAGKTALDKARDNNHKDVALLLARAPQVGICTIN